MIKRVVDWAKKVMDDNLKAANNEASRMRIKRKIVHTFAVIQAGEEIMDKEKTIKWNRQIGYLICLLHDIGRFPQAQTKSFDDEISGIDHACVGVAMIKKSNLDIPNIDIVLEAIEWHSRKINECQSPYAKLIRDADKTANFRHYVEMEEIDWETYNLSGTIIREEYLNRFLAGYEKMEAEYETIAEWYLHNSAWMWDLNFEATREIWREEKFPAMILNKLKKLGIDSRQYELIENKINSF